VIPVKIGTKETISKSFRVPEKSITRKHDVKEYRR